MDPKALLAKEDEELVEQLCRDLTCTCARPHPPPTDGAAAVVANNAPGPAVGNLSPTAFLSTHRQAAVDASLVVGEFARRWGPAGPGRYQRRSVQPLVDDKIYLDLNLPAEDDLEDEERRHKRNVSSSNLDSTIPGPSKRKRSRSPPNITELAGSKVAAADAEDAALKENSARLGEEQNQDDGTPGLGNAHIIKRLEQLISNVKAQANRTFPENFLGKLSGFRSQVAKESGSAVETSTNVASALSGLHVSRYNDEATVGTTELDLHMNVISAHPEERRREIGTSAIAATMPEEEQNQVDRRQGISQADLRKRAEELVSRMKNRARPLPEHYLGQLNWSRSLVATDHGCSVDTSAHVGNTLSDQHASLRNDEGIVGERELHSQMNDASAQTKERMPKIGTSTIAGGLLPMHGNGGMSSQPATGKKDKASEDVHEDNACLQVTVPDTIPRVPQPSPPMEHQLASASPRREQDDLDRAKNNLDEMQPGPSSSTSAPP